MDVGNNNNTQHVDGLIRVLHRRDLAYPLLTGPVEIGLSPTLVSRNGDPGTWEYTLYRDGSPIAGMENVIAAVLGTYTFVEADIGPRLWVVQTSGDGAGTNAAASNRIQFDSAVYLPNTAIWANPLSGNGITETGGEVTAWQSRWGGVSCLLQPPAATHRPAYATDGVSGRATLTFDGVDDFLRGAFTKGSAFDDHEFGVVGERISFAALGNQWFGYWVPNSVMFSLNDQDASRFRFTSTGAASVTPSATYNPTGVLAHYSADATTGTLNARVGGVVAATAAASPISRADGNTVIMGASQTATVGPWGTVPANVKIHAAYMGPYLTANQRLHVRALLTYLTGVAA